MVHVSFSAGSGVEAGHYGHSLSTFQLLWQVAGLRKIMLSILLDMDSEPYRLLIVSNNFKGL